MELVELITNLGFPIAIAAWALWQMRAMSKEHVKSLTEVTEKYVASILVNTNKLNDLTHAIDSLADKVSDIK